VNLCVKRNEYTKQNKLDMKELKNTTTIKNTRNKPVLQKIDYTNGMRDDITMKSSTKVMYKL